MQLIMKSKGTSTTTLTSGNISLGTQVLLLGCFFVVSWRYLLSLLSDQVSSSIINWQYAKGAGILVKLMSGSQNIHKLMIHNVMKSPMSFFDVTPSGWILNRFSKDMDISKLISINTMYIEIQNLIISGHQDTIPCWGLWAVPLPDTRSGFNYLLLLSLVSKCLSDHHCLCGGPWLDYAIWCQRDQEARQPAKGDNPLTPKKK